LKWAGGGTSELGRRSASRRVHAARRLAARWSRPRASSAQDATCLPRLARVGTASGRTA